MEASVKLLEDSPLFNAGKGSVFTAEGTHEMDAAIMEGKNLRSRSGFFNYGHKESSSLGARCDGKKLSRLSCRRRCDAVCERVMVMSWKIADYFYDEVRYKQWQGIKDTDGFQLDHSVKKDGKFGTVGAVACDSHGNIAAATSTGGMTNKKWGRVGDSPMIGAGNYANNKTCAVSCTGSGEFFIRGVVAYDVSCLMEFKGCLWKRLLPK